MISNDPLLQCGLLRDPLPLASIDLQERPCQWLWNEQRKIPDIRVVQSCHSPEHGNSLLEISSVNKSHKHLWQQIVESVPGWCWCLKIQLHNFMSGPVIFQNLWYTFINIESNIPVNSSSPMK